MNVIEKCRERLVKYIPKEQHKIHKDEEDLYRLTPGGCLYIIQLGDTNIYKIGISIDPHKRVKQLQSKCPVPLNLLWWNFGHDYKHAEKLMHHFFRDKRVKGEWFKLSTEDIFLITETNFHIRYDDDLERHKN